VHLYFAFFIFALLFAPFASFAVAFLLLRTPCAFDARENVHEVASKGPPCD